MSDPQLIDDIAAEYPDLREEDELAGGGAEAEADADAELGLTDEALRQFANAAAMHYELSHPGAEGGAGGEGNGMEGPEMEGHEIGGDGDPDGDAADGGGLDPSLGQVVSGSIPPPPRPTYHAHADAGAGEKRKRGDGGDDAYEGAPEEEQPIQPQQARGHLLSRVPGHQHGAARGEHGPLPPPLPSTTTMTTPTTATPFPPQLGPESASSLTMYREPLHHASDPSLGTGAGAGAGGRRKPSGTVVGGRGRVRSHGALGGEEMMLTDGGGEGSDPGAGGHGHGGGGGGRKEGKDERSARRAEQNRRAQQNFRKRREEQMKEQAARLEVLIPQMDEMKRQQAETGFLLEALKLENTALRAVLVHAVKHGAKILDSQGELVGVSSSTANMGMVSGGVGGGNHGHVAFPQHPLPRPGTEHDPSSSSNPMDDPPLEGDEEGEGEGEGEGDSSDETTKAAVQDVYAALDRLGARTHVYARTIVPLVVTPEEQQQHGHGQDGMGGGHGGMIMNSAAAVARSRHSGGGGAPAHVHAHAQGKSLQHPAAVAQSSIRTAQQHHHHHQQQHQGQGQGQVRSPYPPTAYGIALPPFPGPAPVSGSGAGAGAGENGRPSSSSGTVAGGGGAVSEQIRAVEEAIAEIDPVLREAAAVVAHHHHEGEGGREGEDGQEEMMDVDPSAELSLP